MFQTKVVHLNEIYKKVFVCFLRKIDRLVGNCKIMLTQVYIYMSHVYVYTPVITLFCDFQLNN